MRSVSGGLQVWHVNNVIDVDGQAIEFFDLQFTNPFFTLSIDSPAPTMEETIAQI